MDKLIQAIAILSRHPQRHATTDEVIDLVSQGLKKFGAHLECDKYTRQRMADQEDEILRLTTVHNET